MGLFADRSNDAYDRVIAKAETDPKNLTSEQKQMLSKLQKENGSRGNRARRALNGN